MLNENKADGSAFSGDNSSMYSLVSEANDVPGGDDARSTSKSFLDRSVEKGDKVGTNLGLLILEGHEGDDEKFDDGDQENEHCEDASAPLSIPETVFLPSEVRSVGGVSGVTHEQHQSHPKDNKFVTYAGYIRTKCSELLSRAEQNKARISADYIRTKCSELLPQASQWRDSLQFSNQNLMPLLLLITAFALFAFWASIGWKRAALRLEEELRKQHSLLPLSVSLLKERKFLIEKQRLLEDTIKKTTRNNGREKTSYEDFLFQDEPENDAILSLKNCYVEASISLGQCSKEWQKWWSNGAGFSDAHASAERYLDEPSFFDDGFTDDMSKLVKGVKDSVVSTTALSYSYIEKAMKKMSYDGIKDTLLRDSYIQSIVSTSPEMVSNSNDTW